MIDPKRLALIAIAGSLLALPAVASDPAAVGALGASVREQAGADLEACGQAQGVALGAETSFLTSDESTMVFKPAAGIEVLKREDLVNWTVVGMFTAQGPADTEVASGTYTVEARADIGTTTGEVRILDKAGNVVQSGDLTIDTDPDAVEPGAEPAQGFKLPLDDKGPIDGKGYYYGTFFCPWYYPYFYPYYFRWWPIYKHGCYFWYYRYYWGYFHWRFCWWPSRYCVHCRHHW